MLTSGWSLPEARWSGLGQPFTFRLSNERQLMTAEADQGPSSRECQEQPFVFLRIRTPCLITGEACPETRPSFSFGPYGMSGCAVVVPQGDRLARAMHHGAMKVERP